MVYGESVLHSLCAVLCFVSGADAGRATSTWQRATHHILQFELLELFRVSPGPDGAGDGGTDDDGDIVLKEEDERTTKNLGGQQKKRKGAERVCIHCAQNLNIALRQSSYPQ